MGNDMPSNRNEVEASGFMQDFEKDNETEKENEDAASKPTFLWTRKLLVSFLIVLILVSVGLFVFTNDSSIEFSSGLSGASGSESNSVSLQTLVSETSEQKGEKTEDVNDEAKQNENKGIGLSVENGTEGVKINDHHDLIATLLLQNYPTREELREDLRRIRGAEVSKEELDVFLLAVKNNSDDISKLKASKNKSANTDISKALVDLKITLQDLRKDLNEQKQVVISMTKRLDKLEKNSGWYHNRISKLEGDPVSTKESIKVHRLEVQTESMWSVNAASENVAFIRNINTGKPLRVTRGFNIPGCGSVTDIRPETRKVITTSCVINN
ncbi:hypothetical protein [Microbulbifer epialgicus]|uniref:Uncharacterized protein n=1 Tax=Microbulbifer epialgicus TaxID=393907 RepID=A0ABV4NTT8_9GAMM